MAVRIAIVEDDKTASAALQSYLERFSKENGRDFAIRIFGDAMDLLEKYKPEYDIIFMDIQMPFMNGMDAAHKLREMDQKVLLVFVTSLTQYALAGYEVDAVDYIVKPVKYFDFAMKFAKTIKKLPEEQSRDLYVNDVRIDPKDIRYIEILGHHVTYHTQSGDYTQYGSLTKLEEQLVGLNFARCNSCYLVNLHYVRRIKGYTVTLDNNELTISQPRKKSFLQAYTEYAQKTQRPLS